MTRSIWHLRSYHALFLIGILWISNHGNAQAATSPHLELPAPARYSLSIAPLSSPSFPQYHQGDSLDALFPPASTLKLLTATAAKLELGDSFTFDTFLSRSGHDWVLTFSGDPTLTSEDLKQLFLQGKEAGMQKIKGDLWLDHSIFSGYENAVGAPWDIEGVCYSAPSSAITLDHNCVPGSIYTHQNGSTRTYIPEQYPLDVSTNAISVSQEEKEATHCDLELLSTISNTYQLGGCLVHRSRPLPLNFAIRNTKHYAKQKIQALFHQLGISLSGEIKLGRPPEPLQLVAHHRSALLSELIETMLLKSDNLIANNLTKMIGHHHFKQAGTFANGTAAIKNRLEQQGINLDHAQLYDGSGLSRNNRLSSRHLLETLTFIASHDHQLHLLNALAVSGESGTLHYRKSMRNAPIKGAIKGKSGSLYATHNMAGYRLDAQGNPTNTFVQLVTDYYPDPNDKANDLLRMERAFYRYLVQKR